MDRAIWVIFAVFTVYRLAQLIAFDSGPFKLFRKLREFLQSGGVDEHGFPESSWGELASCPYCLGLYFSLLVIPLLFFHTWPGDIFLIWFGIAGMQTLLQGITDSK